MRIAVVATVLVVFVVAGCASGPSPLPSALPSAGVAGSASASPAGARELPADTTDLPADRYARPDLLPGVSFALDDGWSSGPLGDGSVEVHHDAGGGQVAVRLAHVTAESAVSAADAMQSTEGITVLATSESRMSGHTGPNLEVESTADAPIDLVPTPTGAIRLDPGERLWLSLFDTAGGVLAVAVAADAATWDAALLAAEPLLESVTIAAD